MRSRLVAVVAVVAVLALCACSRSMPSAKAIRAGEARACTTSKQDPAKDVLLAVVGGLLLVGAVASQGGERSAGQDVFGPSFQLVLFGAPGVIFTAGGVAGASHGYASAGACEERNALSRTATP